MTEPVLTPGQWEALLFQVPKQVHPFVVRLALAHGHLKPCPPAECPVCGAKPGTAVAPEQMTLEATR